MGLEVLENKYKLYIKKYPGNISRLQTIAHKIAAVQCSMRDLLDGITSGVCASCEHPCCQCMPVDGWFTESDYFIFRMLYEAPFNLRVPHDSETGCSFLGSQGCVLPKDIRPYPCVKVNCKVVTQQLEAGGKAGQFNRLYDELGSLQEQVWSLLSEFLSSNVLQAQSS